MTKVDSNGASAQECSAGERSSASSPFVSLTHSSSFGAKPAAPFGQAQQQQPQPSAFGGFGQPPAGQAAPAASAQNSFGGGNLFGQNNASTSTAPQPQNTGFGSFAAANPSQPQPQQQQQQQQQQQPQQGGFSFANFGAPNNTQAPKPTGFGTTTGTSSLFSLAGSTNPAQQPQQTLQPTSNLFASFGGASQAPKPAGTSLFPQQSTQNGGFGQQYVSLVLIESLCF